MGIAGPGVLARVANLRSVEASDAGEMASIVEALKALQAKLQSDPTP